MFRLFVLLLLALPSRGVKLELHDDGSYDVLVNGTLWLTSGVTKFHANGKWYDTTIDMKLVHSSSASGHDDPLGAYHWTRLDYAASDGFRIGLVFYTYDDGSAIEFIQDWSDGAERTNVSTSPDDTLSSFPSFKQRATSAGALGVLGFAGTFINNANNGPNIGSFPANSATGKDGGPNVIFSAGGSSSSASNDALVLSPSSEFMSHVQAFDASSPTNASTLMVGVIGSATSIPTGFTSSTIVYHHSGGINDAMTACGRALLKRFGKATDGPAQDYQVRNLGYNTDHGAYYYYNTEHGKRYDATLLDVKAYAKREHIPYKHILLDSWWYYKGKGGGVANWTVRDDIFPGGGDAALSEFTAKSEWPIIGHNRYWSSNTPYAEANGGQWQFSLPVAGSAGYVVPLTFEFWDWLLAKSKAWGLATYEQDWLYNEFEGVPLLTGEF